VIETGLRSLLYEGRHPYSSFTARKDLPTASAASIYCLDPPEQSVIDCSRVSPARDFDLTGRIAVIGDASGDTHESVLGEVPGVVLHANYIEALLDDRYYIPLGQWTSILVILLSCGVIQLVFWTTEKPEKAWLYSVGALLLLAVVGYFCLVQFQFLLPPVFEMGGLLVFTTLRYLDTRAHGLHQHSVPPHPAYAPPLTESEQAAPLLPTPPLLREPQRPNDESKDP
jgi:hypothetical protein